MDKDILLDTSSASLATSLRQGIKRMHRKHKDPITQTTMTRHGIHMQQSTRGHSTFSDFGGYLPLKSKHWDCGCISRNIGLPLSWFFCKLLDGWVFEVFVVDLLQKRVLAYADSAADHA